ncbi:MAG: acyl-CoA dehydratase activase [Syntrophales bacterium]|nr:acyl-CoA dehydratase activase [Syntrophales bacterium]
MKRWLGLDLGASFVKAALLSDGRLIDGFILPVSGRYREVVAQILETIETSDLAGMGITGVGVEGVDLSAPRFSEVAAHARGVNLFFPHVKTVIDIGGQFTRVVRVGPGGKVLDFIISEKCATGSGRFLQIMARILHVDIEELGRLSFEATQPVEFSTNCAVFAESEAISRLAEGAKPADIVAGVHHAMAAKVEMLMKRINWEPPVAVVGGGGQDKGLIRAVEKKLQIEVVVPPQPIITAALGAASLASLDVTSRARDYGADF